MKKFTNGFCAYFFLVLLFSTCNAGLLDLLLGNTAPSTQLFNNNNNQNINQLSRTIQNLAASRDRYNPRNTNWAQPVNSQSKGSFGINDNDNDDDDDDDSENRRYAPTNVATNTNIQNVVTNQVSGLPFTNGNSGLHGNPLSSNDVLSPIPINPLVSRPITNVNPGRSSGNINKIMQDVSKINSIMDQIKQQNAINRGNGDTGNIKTNNYNRPHRPAGFVNNYPIIHVNQGVHTNNPNDFSNPVFSQLPKVKPHINIPLTRLPETNLNSAVTNPPVVSPPPGNLMTNVPEENIGGQDTDSNDNTQSTNNKKIALKRLTKRKFFFQVTPVLPDDKIVKHNETVYYI
ncbi:unnamed protein product [Leptosia nina]|uniref:Uncharacterized protein n=1 Tax=Leptosia nina TaxID=320188 RepID=A0AAV1J3P5_9NEOP